MQIALDYNYRPRSRANLTSVAAPAAHKALTQLIARGDDKYAELLEQSRRFSGDFERIAVEGHLDGPEPVWLNGFIPALDAISIYALLALHNPRIYLEIGSGHSTKFARRAIRDHGLRTEIVSIDPMPRAVVTALCNLEIRTPLEDVNLAVFDELKAGDMLFIDCSHRSFQNSDVTVFMTEVLPMLAPGVIYGLHDIFLPFDYPAGWENNFYNEQYLLQAYLLGGGGGDDIVLPNCYVCQGTPSERIRAARAGLFASSAMARTMNFGGCFWMRRGTSFANAGR